MSEQIFLNSDKVLITISRIVIDNKTYALSGVTAVWKEENSLDYGELIMKAVIGIFLLLIPTISALFQWLMFEKEYKVVISTASGEIIAYKSTDGQIVNKIVEAINQALIARR